MKARLFHILMASTGGGIGGEETFVRNLAVGLMERGHRVTVAPGGRVQMEELRRSGVPCAELAVAGRSLPALWRGAAMLDGYARENKVDIVHCHTAGPAVMAALGRMRGLVPGCRCIFHNHGIKPFTNRWLPFFLNRLDLTIAISDAEYIRLAARGVRPDKLVRIHNAVDMKQWSFSAEERAAFRRSVAAEFGFDAASPVFGYVGRLSPEKGCDLFIPAAERIFRQFPAARFLIVGDGPLRAELERAAVERGIAEQVVFTGFRHDVGRLMSAFDVMMLPSYSETFSLSVLQSMALEVPVVASDVGGNPEEIASGYDGLLFPPGNAAALAEQVCALLGNDGFRREAGRLARPVVAGYFGLGRLLDQVEAAYRRTAGEEGEQ